MTTGSAIPSSYTGPGLVDLQVNGYAGVNFNCDPEDLTAEGFHKVREAMNRRGVIAALPTFITDDFDRTLARVEKYRAIIEQDAELAEAFPKLHIEGPFISPVDGSRGAHPKQHCLAPTDKPDAVAQLNDTSGGRIGILTLAPELPGSVDMIAQAVEAGMIASLGHTNPSNEDVDNAIAAGASMCTHLGNGSHQTMNRLNNYIQKQLSMDELWAGFIPDGHHIPFFTLKNMLRAKTTARSFLVTDAIAAAEMGAGTFQLSVNDAVEVLPNGFCQIAGQKNLAGSALTLDKAVINVAKYCDVDWQTAWEMASTTPASLVGLAAPKQVTVAITDEGFELQ